MLLITNGAHSQITDSWSQDTLKSNVTILEPDETYILIFTLDSIIQRSKCNCAVSGNSSDKCNLLKGRVRKVIYLGDTSVFDPYSFGKLQYFLVPQKKMIYKEGLEYLISAYNSTSKNYIIINRNRSDNNTKYSYKYNLLTGLVKCYKRNLFQCLGLQKIDYSEKRLLDDRFDSYILKNVKSIKFE